jgi:hypothetical protein
MQAKKKVIMFLVVGCATIASAQDSLVFIRGLPQTGDTTDQKIGTDVPPYNNHQKITIDQIPAAIKRELRTDDVYQGWVKANVTLDQNTKFYWVSIPADSVLRTFIFDKRGNLVRMEEKCRKALEINLLKKLL